MTDAPDAPVAALDLARIGDILTRLPVIAASLRHASIASSLDYIHPLSADGDPELEFVSDMLTEPLDVIHDKWYGGRFNASRFGAATMDAVIERLRAMSAARK
jgi:hypothetical protein